MNENLINELKEKGIIKIENFLNINEIQDLTNIIKHYSAFKNTKNSFWPTNSKLLILKLIKLDFKKFNSSIKILNLSKKKNLMGISKNFFSNNSFLNYIDAYISPVSNNPVIPWHTDQAYHGDKKPQKYVNPEKFFLKIFIYLTDVEPENGCMAYIPKSHKIGYAIRKGIFEKKIDYKPYWHLKDLRKILIDKNNKNFFKNHFDNNSKIVENFLMETEFCEKNVDTKNYDYNLKAGSAIIFDEGGVHRGAKTLKNDRMVLRYLYSKYKN